MLSPPLQERLSAYRQWRTRVAGAIEELGDCLNESQLATHETRAWMAAALARLRTERLNVAFVSGGGRGASDLINALFFHDLGRRLLPSYTGRPEPCPTELCWDADGGGPLLRLLPIETLGQGVPFAQLRAEPAHWVSYTLDVPDPEQTASRLRQVTQTKIVSPAEAVRLGLAKPQSKDGAHAGPLEIPRWRHAIVSFPSALLRLGLAIFDIPNPGICEGSTDLLAQSQIAVYVLAADQGDTPAGLDLCRRHLRAMGSTSGGTFVVAVNKVDQLWDQQDDGEADPSRQIARRRVAIASGLGIDVAQVFPVSAQMALLARARRDQALLGRTGIEALEAHIATGLLHDRQKVHIDGLGAGLTKILDHNQARIVARIERTKTHLTALAALRDKSNALIARILEGTRHDQDLYLRGVQHFQADRDALALETEHCREILDRDKIQSLILQTHIDMARSWTTAGMIGTMMGLFEELRRAMQAIATESERVRKRVRETYEGFQRDLGFAATLPKVFVPMKFRVEIELLYQEVDAFRRSPSLVLTEQGVVIKRFHQEMVSRAQVLFDQLRAAFDTWTRDTLQPLAEQIEQHKQGIERRLDALQRHERSKDATQGHIDESQAQFVELGRQLTALRNIRDRFSRDLDAASAAGADPPAAARQS
jgi:hypothetical protein